MNHHQKDIKKWNVITRSNAAISAHAIIIIVPNAKK
jgi:hypothetical protein